MSDFLPRKKTCWNHAVFVFLLITFLLLSWCVAYWATISIRKGAKSWVLGDPGHLSMQAFLTVYCPGLARASVSLQYRFLEFLLQSRTSVSMLSIPDSPFSPVQRGILSQSVPSSSFLGLRCIVWFLWCFMLNLLGEHFRIPARRVFCRCPLYCQKK